MIGDGWNSESTLTLRQGCKGDDLVCGEPVHRRAGLQIVKQLFGDVLADRLRPSPQGSGLVRSEPYGVSSIGEERQRRPSLQRLCIITNLDVSLMASLGKDVSRSIRHP